MTTLLLFLCWAKADGKTTDDRCIGRTSSDIRHRTLDNN